MMRWPGGRVPEPDKAGRASVEGPSAGDRAAARPEASAAADAVRARDTSAGGAARADEGERTKVFHQALRQEDAWVVAVTGHRPGRLSSDHFEHGCAQAARLLDGLVDAAAEQGGPVLVLRSALAEGADRRLAQLALERGFVLHVVLPFRRVNYSRDFATTASRLEFKQLLQRAERVSELPGRRSDAPQAYRDAGLAMLVHADLLLALWDGAPGAGRGGTADIVDEAWRRHLPVVHLGTAHAALPRVLWRADPRRTAPTGLLGALRARGLVPAVPPACAA
jgi:hypothetical protein